MAGGVITTGNTPKALFPGIRAWWGRVYDEHNEEYPDLFDIKNSTQNYEEDVLIGGFGLAAVKEQGQSIGYDSEIQGYVSRYTHVVYGIGYITTREEIEDNLYETVGMRRSEAAAFSLRQTEENVCANVYNRAYTSAYTGGDGVTLINTAHPTRNGNQSNRITTAADLSESSLEDLIIQMMGATNERGLKISLMPRVLLVHRNDWFEATRILKSVLQNDTANNAINALKATNSIPEGAKVNHYFTDTDAWFIRSNIRNGMNYFLRRDKEFEEDNDFDTHNWKAQCHKRFSVGWTDWRGTFGSPGS